MKKILIALVLVGCGKSDDCSKLFDKMASAMKDTADGKDLTKDKDKFLEMCRKHSDKMKDDPVMQCVLDASGDDAVKACIGKPLDDYKKKGKMNEAAVQLNALGKHAKVVFAESGAFPKGMSSVLPANPTNNKGCCGTSDAKCPVSKDWETDPVWKALDFRIDEPTMYRYKYESADGKSFTATAVGDTDCDGQDATFTLTGSVDASGNPTADLKLPEKGQY